MDMKFYKEITANNIVAALEKKLGRKLPNYGLVCGGSVCNTLLSLLDDKSYPINDIDLFLSEDPITFINKNLKNIAFSEDKTYEYLLAFQETYHVVESIRNGLLNYVFYKLDGPLHTDLNLMVLEAFDINCCQIGIDLSTLAIHSTPEFNKFVEDRELKITTTLTPAHTAIRIVKKAKELNVKLDKSTEFKKLFQFFSSHKNNKKCTLLFGRKYMNMYYEYREDLLLYFSLNTYADYKINTWNDSGFDKKQYTENEPTKENIKKWLKTELYTLIPRYSTYSHEWEDIIPVKN